MKSIKGAPSPYNGDMNTYVWDWCLDCYRVAETGAVLPSIDDRALAVHAIKTLGFTTDDHAVPVDLMLANPATEFTVELTPDRRHPVSVTVCDDDNWGSAVFNHPSWKGIDWEDEEYCWDCGC